MERRLGLAASRTGDGCRRANKPAGGKSGSEAAWKPACESAWGSSKVFHDRNDEGSTCNAGLLTPHGRESTGKKPPCMRNTPVHGGLLTGALSNEGEGQTEGGDRSVSAASATAITTATATPAIATPPASATSATSAASASAAVSTPPPPPPRSSRGRASLTVRRRPSTSLS